ncbi:DUF2187 family protein [Bacillus sp. CECT 9360]|uniref:DUF2187 family protein n=1 Tax=Bacillus sp. CECT 9360 TaxID=2845821 RepID=UPI001E32A82B|nr:DUF2187 family protein [Bacillus sp. CECT 9360]CAH0344817.1 hypothetical protein BCI9360_01085 [Bacillus sp. CECT 9360]
MQEANKIPYSKKQAKVGDTILFERKEISCEGTVFQVRENSVLVEISKEMAQVLDYETPNTVVRHGNYTIRK